MSPIVEYSTGEKYPSKAGHVILSTSMQVSVSELANTKDLLQRQNFIIMPCYHACFQNLSIAALDPIDRVQPRSRTTCVGWLALKGSSPKRRWEDDLVEFMKTEEGQEKTNTS